MHLMSYLHDIPCPRSHRFVFGVSTKFNFNYKKGTRMSYILWPHALREQTIITCKLRLAATAGRLAQLNRLQAHVKAIQHIMRAHKCGVGHHKNTGNLVRNYTAGEQECTVFPRNRPTAKVGLGL